MSNYLSEQQVAQLLRPINPLRVSRNQDGQSHVEAYEIRAHLNRVFGFGRWSGDVLNMDLLYERDTMLKKWKPEDPDKPGVEVAYRCLYRLTVNAPSGAVLATYTEGAVGSGAPQPTYKRADAHDFAAKTAESQALKRCAMNLGDQFGLSLYRNGSTQPLVVGVLNPAPKPAEDTQAGDEEKAKEDVTEHITAPLPPEDPDPEPERETSTAPARPANPDPAPGRAPAQTAEVSTLAGDTAQSIRDLALGPVPDGKRPKAWLMSLMTKTAKAGVGKARVDDGHGNAVSLDALLSQLLQQDHNGRRGA